MKSRLTRIWNFFAPVLFRWHWQITFKGLPPFFGPMVVTCSDAPPPPDYAKANREAILTDIETLPMRYEARAEWEPILLQLMLQSQADSADYTADAMLDVQERYGPGFINARQQELKMSDPMGTAAREALYNQVMYDLTGQVPDKVDYQVSYPEPEQTFIGSDRALGLADRLEAMAGQMGSQNMTDEQMQALVEAIYPYYDQNNFNANTNSGPSYMFNLNNDLDAQRNDLYAQLGIDPPPDKRTSDFLEMFGISQTSDSPNVGLADGLSGGDMSARLLAAAERLRGEGGGQSYGNRPMPEVTEVRTPGEFTPNEALYASPEYESTLLAEELFTQIMADLGLEAQLNDSTRREVQQGVRGAQAARGNILGNSAIYEEAMELGQAGEQRQQQRQQNTLQFLTSGTTPEDIAYRKKQQAMANLGSFMGGQTPVAQFGQLAGAQQGAAPYAPQNAPQVLNPNAGAQGAQFAQQNYAQQMNAYSQQANPWMAGLSLGVSALGVPLVAGGAASGSTVAGALF